MNKVIDKVTSIGITLALSTSLGLSACAKKQNNYIPMSEVFYDRNNEGIDDTFQQKITESSIQIEKITKLERCIDLIKKIRAIDFNDEDKTEMISITKEEVDNINLDIVESVYEEYQIMTDSRFKLTDSHKQKQLKNMKKDLYNYYIVLNTYINNYGYNTIYDFGMDLYKSIILDTSHINGNETNIEATVNNYMGGGSPDKHIARSKKSDETIRIESNSKLYNLIGKVSEYKEYEKLKDFHIIIIYDEKLIEELKDVIDFYKECIYTKYEVENNSFLFLQEPDTIVSKETKVPIR